MNTNFISNLQVCVCEVSPRVIGIDCFFVCLHFTCIFCVELRRELTNSIAESSLVSLNVAYNDISEAGLYPFLEAVRQSSIYSLYLLGNYFTQPSTNVRK